jgi:hypothetical protein
MKYTADRPFTDPEKAARKLLEIASTVEPIQDGRIHIEKINGLSCSRMAAGRPNTVRASPSQSRKAGCGAMNPAPM